MEAVRKAVNPVCLWVIKGATAQSAAAPYNYESISDKLESCLKEQYVNRYAQYENCCTKLKYRYFAVLIPELDSLEE